MKITDTAAIDQAGLDRTVVVQTVIRAMVKQVLIDGFFHGDPHPGNLSVDPQTGIVTFLDLGLMGELSQTQRFDLLDLVWSFVHGDTQSIATVALRFTERHGPIDERAFRAEVERLYYQYWVYATGNTSAVGHPEGPELRYDDVWSAHEQRFDDGDQSHFAGRSDRLHATARTGTGYRSPLTKRPDPLGEQFTVERVVESVKTQAVRSAKDLLRELPDLQDAAGQWLEQFRRGRFVVELNTDELAESVKHFSQSMRRVTVALILIGMLIGSAIASSLLVTLQDTEWAFLPVVAMGIFVGSALLSVVVVLRMLQAERADKP